MKIIRSFQSEKYHQSEQDLIFNIKIISLYIMLGIQEYHEESNNTDTMNSTQYLMQSKYYTFEVSLIINYSQCCVELLYPYKSKSGVTVRLALLVDNIGKLACYAMMLVHLYMFYIFLYRFQPKGSAQAGSSLAQSRI